MLVLATLVSCMAPNHGTWPNGIIPFMLVGINRDEAKKIFDAMYLWEAASMGRIQFRLQLDNQDDYTHTNRLYIVKNETISGTLGTGYFPGEINVVFLDRFEQRAILHELGHKIGLEHEHQRPDRDLFITIDWNKVSPEFVPQFSHLEPELYDYTIYQYDYESVMHYGEEDTSAIDSHGYPIGSSSISFFDAMKVQDMYENNE